MTLYVEQIGLIPVSKACAIGLYASGPYGRQQIEALIGMLQLQVELGCYDSDALAVVEPGSEPAKHQETTP